MNFACELMDLCRGTQEVEAVLSEGGDKESVRDPLARLKMAMEYEEKKVLYFRLRCRALPTTCRILQFLCQMFNASSLLLDVALLKCVVTEVVLFSIVAFKTLTFHNLV